MPDIKVQSLPNFDPDPVKRALATSAATNNEQAVTDDIVAAALLGWTSGIAGSSSLRPGEAVTGQAQSPAKPTLRCQYCLRTITPGQTITVNVIKSHRRFCAYIHPLTADGKSPWQIQAEVLTESRAALANVQTSSDVPTSKTYQAALHPRYFGMIASGAKLWEGRCFRGQWTKIQVGDLLHFTQADDKTKSITRRVLDIRRYADFRDMLETDEMLQGCLPGINDIEEGLDVYHGFPGYLEASLQHGAVAFKLGDPSIDPANPTGDATEHDYLKRRARAQLLKEEVGLQSPLHETYC